MDHYRLKIDSQLRLVDVLLLDTALQSLQSERETLTRSLSYVSSIKKWLFEVLRKKVDIPFCQKSRQKPDQFFIKFFLHFVSNEDTRS